MPQTKSRLKIRFAMIFVAITVVAACLSYRGMRLHFLVRSMGNDDVTSDGGHELRYAGATKLIVEEFGLGARGILKSKLNDPNRFAAAHIALADITGAKTGTTWHAGPGQFVYHCLNYSRNQNNVVRFELENNTHLTRWWHNTVGANVGIPVVSEETDELFWPKRAR